MRHEFVSSFIGAIEASGLFEDANWFDENKPNWRQEVEEFFARLPDADARNATTVALKLEATGYINAYPEASERAKNMRNMYPSEGEIKVHTIRLSAKALSPLTKAYRRFLDHQLELPLCPPCRIRTRAKKI